MPGQSKSNPAVEKALDVLEDYTLTTYLSRCENYQIIHSILNEGCELNQILVKRILGVCTHDLNEDMKYATNAINLISVVLQKFQATTCIFVPELLASALAILKIISTTSMIAKVMTLQVLCFETFLSYPIQIYVTLGSEFSSEILEVLKLYFDESCNVAIKSMPFKILLKILKSLPPDEKTAFVNKGLDVWFSKVIPATLSITTATNSQQSFTPLDALELLTEELEKIDYTANVHWQNTLECIYTPQKYPAIMKSLLESGNDCWCRLWNIFVRLLKQQITMNKSKLGSPINSMLPVVEMAFKMDVHNRCRAFKCWSVLIDNFATETSEMFIHKRVKLLVIPLKSNNAKFEDTALAKFETWWHLIVKFQSRIDELMDLIFVPFLHFCFGNPKNVSDPNVLIPGLLSLKLKRQCVQSFVESTGHIECAGCISQSFQKLNKSILNPKTLKDHLHSWMFALKAVIRICGAANFRSENSFQQLRCIWKSFISTSAQLDDNTKNVAINEFLNMMSQFVENDHKNEGVLDLVFNVLLQSLLNDTHLKKLMDMNSIQDESLKPICLIHRLILNPLLFKYYPSIDGEASVQKLKPFTNCILDKSIGSPNDFTAKLLNELPANDNGLILWTTLAQSLLDGPCDINTDNLKNVLLWPLKNMQHFKNADYSATVWDKSYKKFALKLSKLNLGREISMILLSNNNTSSCNQLLLYALLQIIKGNLADQKNADCKVEAELLTKLLSRINDHESVIAAFPVIVECLLLLLTKSSNENDVILAKHALKGANFTLKLLIQAQTSESDHEIGGLAEKIIKAINDLFTNEVYVKLKHIVVNQLVVCSTVFDKNLCVKEAVYTVLQTILKNSLESEVPLYTMLLDALSNIKNNIKSKKGSNTNDKNKFSTPDNKVKRGRKKEPKIVNTVIENGEEYVVVNSNWKFNPKKLTENQKEKFQKKREDIPALYQDLSQSQDEFKIASWKPDSQDTSTMDSKSTSLSNNDTTTILNKIPSTELVPKIMENIYANNKISSEIMKDSLKDNSDADNNKLQKCCTKSLSSPKLPKSPKVALKDRVFQNVKNLIEKSSLAQDKSTPQVLTQNTPETALVTPMGKSIVKPSTVGSAPSRISLERPSRMKRKPIKYEKDFEELSLKKRRSLILNEFQNNNSKASGDNNIIEEHKPEHSKSTIISDLYKTVNLSDKTKEGLAVNSVDDLKCQNDVTPDSTTTSDNKEDFQNTKIIDIAITNDTTETCKDVIEEFYSPELKDDSKLTTVTPSNSSNLKSISNSDSINTTPVIKTKNTEKIKTTYKKTKRKSRIENELVIDMVEGHPFLKAQNDKRTTRKSVVETITGSRRKALTEKLSKLSQSDSKIDKNHKKQENQKNKINIEKKNNVVKDLFSDKNTQDNSFDTRDDLPMSEDFIESSQDSTMTTISVRSNKNSAKKLKVLDLNLDVPKKEKDKNRKSLKSDDKRKDPQDSVDNNSNRQDSKDDIEFSQNRSVPQETDLNDVTADMNTEPIASTNIVHTDEVILIDDCNTQNTANADTQSMDPNLFKECNIDNQLNSENSQSLLKNEQQPTKDAITIETNSLELSMIDRNKSIELDMENGLSSPFKDEDQRNKEFLNNTLEISPIKIMSPIKEGRQSPSPENSNDYVVIQLSSPVQINGEPFEQSASPEIFTEDKVSPQKSEQSPPRPDIIVNNSSPNSSLSLKKNRPQVRQGNRAAQMLGLCVPDRLQNFVNIERSSEQEETKKGNQLTTPARRNLRILYNCGDNDENIEENKDSENFLKFKRALPTADSSPSVPILKRKLVDITDESTMSPASKRKRVSFHDPPVSTTVAVQKYIEPLGTRSPQNSAAKKLERQLRTQGTIKSPKNLENIFKLDTTLTKTVEELGGLNSACLSEDIDMSSLDQTPAVEVVKTTDLNNTDPICPELLTCKDPIEKIASDLSSPDMKSLLIKELEGKVETIGDLAQMTELDVNRLCVKAPKVEIVRKVLTDYAAKLVSECEIIESVMEASATEDNICPAIEMAVQTDDISVKDTDTQTNEVSLVATETQTNVKATTNCSVQTECMTTRNLIESSLSERSDFINELTKQLGDDNKTEIAQDLPLNVLSQLTTKKIENSKDTALLLDCLLQSKIKSDENFLTLLEDKLCQRYDTKRLILFCSQLLRKLHDKTP